MTRLSWTVLALLLSPLAAGAQTVSYFNFTDDASSQISSAKTYTARVDFGAAGAAPTVNGVAFQKVGTSGLGASSFAFADATGLGAVSGNSGNAATAFGYAGTAGNVAALLDDFVYSQGAPTTRAIALSGLTAGQTYSLRVYARPWGDAAFPDRATNITIGSQTFAVNEDNITTTNSAIRRDQAYAINLTYTASGASQSVTFAPANAAATFHFYGLTNEIAPVPEPATVLAAAGLGLAALGRLRRKSAVPGAVS